MMNLLKKTIMNILFLRLTLEIIQVPPIWITSPYLKAGFNNIITVLTGNTATPTATIPFPGGAFTSIPNIGYGASTYNGNDALGTQMWEINRTGLTTSSFSVLIQIVGITNLRFLTVRFIAVDIFFPHNLNSYDNVPVNYSAGPLVNISVKGTTTSPSFYTNTINFTKQSAGRQYKYFSSPFSSNKILLFMTSFFHSGTNEATLTSANPVKLLIDYEIISNETYKLMVSLGIKDRVDKLHFSMIIFDQADVERSGLYLLIYQRIDVNYTGGFLPLPIEFVDNFIIGLTNLTTNRTKSQIQFSWNLTNLNGINGYFMPVSTSTSTSQAPVVTLGFSYFYLKTWFCPNQTFFDPSLNLCTGCPIINCRNCYNLTMCWLCDEENGYHLNLATGQCDYCSIVGCQNCTILSNNTLNFSSYSYQEVCLECNSTNSYQLRLDGTCELCKNEFNIFLNPLTLKCQACSIPYCSVCFNLEICTLCDLNNSYGGDPLNNGCVYCNNSLNYFINESDYECAPCLLEGCKVCLSLNECAICNETAGYSLNFTSSLCEVCLMQNCFLCINQTWCVTCLTGYFVNFTSGVCETCQLQGCLKCLDLYVCLECDMTNNYDFDETISNATTCTQCNTSCLCNGYVQPWNSVTQSCNSFCGDGLIRIAEECDDNNTLSGDGCSSLCIIQSNFFCSSEPSECVSNGSELIGSIKVQVKKEKCNTFSVVIYLLDADIYELIKENDVKILNSQVEVTEMNIEPEKVLISAKYKQSLLEPIQLQILGSVQNVTVSQLFPFIFYTEEECKSEQSIKLLMDIIQISSYILLVISLLSCKIIGLELFGILQLSYFALIEHDFVVLYLQPLTKFRTFNGLNLMLLDQSSEVPQIFQVLGHQATFLNNCNIMYFLLIFELLVSFLLYFIYLISRSDKLRNFSLRLMKQGFITLLIFNCYNFSFSTGSHFKYSEGGVNYWIGVVMIVLFLVLLVLATLAMLLSNSTHYGQFIDKFKDNCVCKLYIPLTILYRLGIGLYISTTFTQIESTLLTLAFVFAFMLYNITNLPFKDTYQNYRSNLIHITELIILFTSNYYRSMKANTPLEIKGFLFAPGILQFVLVIVSVFISIILLAYEIYLQIRKWKKTRKIKSYGNLNQLSQATLH